MENLQVLLEKHNRRTITEEERAKLNKLVRESYGYGKKIPGYTCPQCGESMMYVWAKDRIACVSSEGGCGFSFEQDGRATI